MKPITRDSERKTESESLERAIRRDRLTDWLVDASIYIHQLESRKRVNKDKEGK